LHASAIHAVLVAGCTTARSTSPAVFGVQQQVARAPLHLLAAVKAALAAAAAGLDRLAVNAARTRLRVTAHAHA
jgi:hypothetical protein